MKVQLTRVCHNILRDSGPEERVVRVLASTNDVIWVGSMVDTCSTWVGESHQANISTIALPNSVSDQSNFLFGGGHDSDSE